MSTLASHPSRLDRLRRSLPRGDTLPDPAWAKRHHFLVAVLAAHAVVLPFFGIAVGYPIVNAVMEGGLLPGLLAAVALPPGPRKLRAGLVTFGLLSCSALLVHFSHGYIEAHFHFFIVVVIIGLYEDWLPFGIALAYVVLHHGLGGTFDPGSIYNHPAAEAHPWRWAAIHGAAISLAGALSIGTWKLNEELRAERLKASRARLIAAADETRRRMERDLHDGAQQQLVSLIFALRYVEADVPTRLSELKDQVSDVAEGLASLLEELQQISRGVHPSVLSKGGLGPALRTLAQRSAVPVDLDVRGDRRLNEQIELAAYYVASEALANAAKHSNASGAHVGLDVQDSVIRLSIRDDGVGGAAPGRGSGLVGLRDRVESVGGTIEIVSPAGCGTSLLVEIPCAGDSEHALSRSQSASGSRRGEVRFERLSD